MKKYISCLAGLLCLVLANICFAGSNEITYFSGELRSVSLIAADGTERDLGMSGHLGLDTDISKNISVGNGSGQIPAGKYTAIKYVFKNHFECKGQVTLRDGVYGSTGALNGGPVFKKGQQPAIFAYDYGTSNDDWGWCKTNAVAGGNLEVTEFGDFTLDENSTKDYNVNVTLAFLWCGQKDDLTVWKNFDESSYVITSNSWVDEDHFALSTDKNTLIEPNIDPLELDYSFLLKARCFLKRLRLE